MEIIEDICDSEIENHGEIYFYLNDTWFVLFSLRLRIFIDNSIVIDSSIMVYGDLLYTNVCKILKWGESRIQNRNFQQATFKDFHLWFEIHIKTHTIERNVRKWINSICYYRRLLKAFNVIFQFWWCLIFQFWCASTWEYYAPIHIASENIIYWIEAWTTFVFFRQIQENFQVS